MYRYNVVPVGTLFVHRVGPCSDRAVSYNCSVMAARAPKSSYSFTRDRASGAQSRRTSTAWSCRLCVSLLAPPAYLQAHLLTSAVVTLVVTSSPPSVGSGDIKFRGYM